MRACRAFFCLLCIPITRPSVWGKSLRTDFLELPRSAKNVKAIEAFVLLLVLAFLPTTLAWAQNYPVLDTFGGSGALSSNWTNTTATAETYVEGTRPRNAHFLLLSICDELCL